MDVVLALLGLLAGAVVGWFVGHHLGDRVKDQRAWRYWLLNLAVLLIGLAGDFLGLTLGQPWLWILSIAFLISALTGLKYGRGKTVGSGSLDEPEHEERDIPRLWED